MNDPITIRSSDLDDRAAIQRLAELDGREAPPGRMLLAFVGDELRAALPPAGGEPLADPFHPTAELIDLLRRRTAARHDRDRRRLWPTRLVFECR